jgi:cytochrome bd ubiquinol oxidase subunit I
MTTEIGRQPWIVQGQLLTVDGVSPSVTTGEVATTLAILLVIYTGVFVAWFLVVRGIVRRGPAPVAAGVETGQESAVQPLEGGAAGMEEGTS